MIMQCKTTFSSIAALPEEERPKAAEMIDSAHPNCECEATSVAQDSLPGKVEDDEVLLRVIWSPHHVEEDTGNITPRAFDDAAKIGLSCFRHSKTDLSSVDSFITEQIKKKKASGKNHIYKGLACYRCQDFRTQKTSSGQRHFGAYNTASADNPAHADVFQTNSGSKIERKNARVELLRCCLSGRNPVNTAEAFALTLKEETLPVSSIPTDDTTTTI